MSSHSISRRIGLILVLLVGFLGLLWVATTSWAGVDLVRRAREAQTLIDVGIQQLDTVTVDSLLRGVRKDVVVLKRNVGWLAPLAPHFGGFPYVGQTLRQAPALLTLGDTLTELGVLMWEDVTPAISQTQQGVPLQGLLPEVLGAVSRDLPHKVQLAASAEIAYAALDVDALPDRLQMPLRQLGEALPLVRSGLGIVESAPALLGLDTPRTYLVLALNEDELRPGGGFITGVGEVKVVGADVAAMAFRDSYAVDDFTQPYPDPPDPLRHFIGADLWVFRDSNWSPDFPTAARQAVALYRPGYAVDVSGVIGIDQHGVAQLVEALEPVSVSEQAEPVTGETVLAYMRDAWAPSDGTMSGDWWRQRKDFMGQLAGAVMERLKSGDVDYLKFGKVVLAALDQRHLQVYLEEATAADVLAKAGWDGGLPAHTGDVVMPVEANVGYNKASTNIERRLLYEVDFQSATPVATTTLSYRHLSDAVDTCQPEIAYDATYEEMMHRCYWAYVRLYVPMNSALIDASTHPLAADQLVTQQAWSGQAYVAQQEGHTTFAQAFLLPTGATETLVFRYALPAGVVDVEPSGVHTYRLLIRKQAGVEDFEAHVSLRLPGNAVVLRTHPGLLSSGDGVLSLDIRSKTDVELSVVYQMPED